MNQRVSLIAIDSDDEALAGYQSYMKCKDTIALPSWEEYIALIETFGEEIS